MDGKIKTERGQVRSTNEDAGAILINEHEQALAIVADGMGGHQAGEVASQLAVQLAREAWENAERFVTPMEAEIWLKKMIDKMNEEILQQSKENESLEGMGTTVVMTICAFEFVTVAHVGDSRCYLLTGEKFDQITEDHSLVNELIRTGEISKEEAEKHPQKNVLLRAVGTDHQAKADVRTLIWEEDDLLLLCSDGLTNKISDEELEHYLREMNDVDQVANGLIEEANKRGGEDNITISIVRNRPIGKVGDE